MNALRKFIAISILIILIGCIEIPNYDINMSQPDEEIFNPEAIQPYLENQRYWQFRNEPVLLLGGSDQDNLYNHPDIKPEGLEYHLDLLVESGGNYVRNTMSSRDEENIKPYVLTNDGKYDLNEWNEKYWDRFKEFLTLTNDRNIIVQIEIWDRWDFAQKPWENNVFNPKNNVNYNSIDSRLPENINTHPNQRENPFFRTPPDLEDNSLVLSYQKAYVNKLISIALEFPNILYCISNETNESPLWSHFWAKYLHDLASEKGITINITEMWDSWELSDKEHDATFDRPDLYSYVDISQNNHQKGQVHWDNAQYVRNERLKDGDRPMNSVKIYGGPRYGGSIEEGIHRFWRNIFGGLASSRFHRPIDPNNPSGIGLNSIAQKHIISMRMFVDQFNIFNSKPDNSLIVNREENEAYVAVSDNGIQFAVYFTDGGEINLNLSDYPGSYSVKWLDIWQNEWLSGAEEVEGGGNVVLRTPDLSSSWAVLIQKEFNSN
jgi:hypothetical protein